jgi:hypothetical protein
MGRITYPVFAMPRLSSSMSGDQFAEPFVVVEPGAVLDELIVGQDAVAVRPFFLRVNWG